MKSKSSSFLRNSKNSTHSNPANSPLGDYGAKEDFSERALLHSPDLPEDNSNEKASSAKEEKTKRNARWRNAWWGRLTLVAYVIGISNITMFPEMFMRNGQLAFLIPVILAYLLIGLPLMFVELIIGQVSALSPNKIFSRVAPLLSAIAGGMSILAIYRAMFFMPQLAQTLYLSILSLQGMFTELPWNKCADSRDCVHLPDVASCSHHWNHTHLKTDFVQLEPACQNLYETLFARQYPEAIETPHLQYLNDSVFRNTYVVQFDWTFLPGPWGVVLCLIFLWVCIASSIFIGPAVIGLIFCLVFTLLPVAFSFVTMTYSLAMDESFKLMGLLTQADFSKLLQTQTWSDAVSFVLFSLSLADGGVIKIASHHHFDNNLILNALFAVGADMFLTLMYLIIYAVATGWVTSKIYIGENLFTSLQSSPVNGRTYAFAAYPEMVSTHSGGFILTFFHYGAILLISMPSMIISLEVVVTSITDRFTKAVKRRRVIFLIRLVVTVVLCFCLCILSMSMLFPGGQYLMQQIFDNSMNCLFLLACMEIIAVIYLYGYQNFIENIEAMLGLESTFVHYLETIIWKGITPLACIFSIFARMAYLVQEDIIVLDYVVPISMRILAWFMFLSIFVLVFGFILFKVVQLKKQKRCLEVLLKPTEEWEARKEMIEIEEEVMKRPLESVMVPASAAASSAATKE